MEHIGFQLDLEQVEYVNPGVRWFTYLNNGHFVQLAMKEQNQFETAILDGHVRCTYVWEDYTCVSEDPAEKYTEYEINLSDLFETFQVNTKTHTIRRLYRIAVQ